MASSDPAAMRQYLDTLYPDPPADAWMVVSWLIPGRGFRSEWIRADNLDAVVGEMEDRQRAGRNVYFNVGLRAATCQPSVSSRGTSADVCALPGLWAELDFQEGVHADASRYPTRKALLAWLGTLPCQPTMLIESGGGFHAYWLFKECWLLETPAEQAQAARLLGQMQRTLQGWAREAGWSIDSTHDLARVLRPPGTLNVKYTPPRQVTPLHADGPRYEPREIEESWWLDPSPESASPPPSSSSRPSLDDPVFDFPRPSLAALTAGCAWLRHCQVDASRLPEPEWYAMLGIVGRCEDGEAQAHAWSTPDPRYTPAETTAKLQHALASGPASCAHIAQHCGGQAYCQACPSQGAVTNPLAVGATRQSTGETPDNTWDEPAQTYRFDFSVGVSAHRLMEMPRIPARFLIPGLIPDGLTIMAAPAKSYKSYFALSLALAALGMEDWCGTFPAEETGNVVFFGLEAPLQQLRNRLHQLCPAFDSRSSPHELTFFTGMKALPTFKTGLQDALEQVIDHYRPRLIVVDPLSYLYRMGRQEDLASATLDLLWPLAEMAAQARVALYAPEHMRKRSKEDMAVIDQLAGSFIKAAVAHGLIMLQRQGEDLILETTMRDAPSQEVAVTLQFDQTFNTISWGYKGSNETLVGNRANTLKAKALAELKEKRHPMKVSDLLLALNLPGTESNKAALRKILTRAEGDGDLASSRRGEYYWIGIQ